MSKQNQILDIMLDIETLGKSTSPVIGQLSGRTFFLESGDLGDSFNKYISPQSCAKVGLTCRGEDASGNTLDWWLTQDKEVFNKVVIKAFLEGEDLLEVLTAFSQWVEEMKKKYNCKYVRVWGNGPSADCVWVRSAYEACHLSPPWKFFEDGCVRTWVDAGIRLLNVNYKKTNEFVGDKHNAIDDCIHQIKYVCQVVKDFQDQKTTISDLEKQVQELKAQLAKV